MLKSAAKSISHHIIPTSQGPSVHRHPHHLANHNRQSVARAAVVAVAAAAAAAAGGRTALLLLLLRGTMYSVAVAAAAVVDAAALGSDPSTGLLLMPSLLPAPAGQQCPTL